LLASARPIPAASDAVLDALEAEAIWVMRETAGAFRRPVLMYSIGKDSSVLLHLARKAFHPGPIPFPLLHIDSTWEFREMIEHRERIVEELGATLIVGINEEGVRDGVTPMSHGVQEYTRIMRTVPLLKSLDEGGFDAAIGGGRRDEERSRSKERIFSLREPGHRWDPRKQRPEFWRTPNTSLNEGQTMRVFPISNWTELDVWRYIRREGIPVVDLYFARERTVVDRKGSLLMLDDDRMPLEPGEVPHTRKVRFRTLGCYPVTAAVESDAETLDDLIHEMETTSLSERAGRLIDGEKGDSMEAKKRSGYF
jgi:sulfate adenylyltransferase subunit 2